MHAAHLLFFACVPTRPERLELCAVLSGRGLARHWSSQEVQWALQVCSESVAGCFEMAVGKLLAVMDRDARFNS